MKEQAKRFFYLVLYLLVIVCAVEFVIYGCQKCEFDPSSFSVILKSEDYHDDYISGVFAKLIHRVNAQPFNLAALIIFMCAVIHTFFARYFNVLSNSLRKKYGQDTFSVEILRFMGEVEVIFGIWVIPLLIIMTYFYSWDSALYYLNTRGYSEAIFVVIIMAIASTGPILSLIESALRYLVRMGGERVQSWWWALLTIGPLLGSFITEPGAMTVCALLLGKKFYELKPSKTLAYATLGLLFVNISVGGVLTCFAAPPVLMVSRAWGWNSLFMLQYFGWKALLGIIASNFVYYLYFRKEFRNLEKKRVEEKSISDTSESQTPVWISIIHVLFLSWVVLHASYPVVIIGTFLLFLGFYQATLPYQTPITLKTPVMVGFFLAALVVHGGLQGWWITPILGNVSEGTMMILATVLTAFNDNAEITFLSTLIPDLTESMKYVIVAGAVTGGGLTVIANAPNPAGQALLSPYFGQGISAARLFYAAFIPTMIVATSFYALRFI